MLKFLMDTPAKVSKNIGAYFSVSEHSASFHFFVRKKTKFTNMKDNIFAPMDYDCPC